MSLSRLIAPSPQVEYALGHSARELDRLSFQASVVAPFTRQLFSQAGIKPGMRVLDVGSGAGDVAFLAAELVGPTGWIIGVDRSATALAVARARANEQSLRNVTFLDGDPTEMTFEQAFDAVVGRYVLMYQADPARMLSKLKTLLRPGGIVVFHEIDAHGERCEPPVPLHESILGWVTKVQSRGGADARMGNQIAF